MKNLVSLILIGFFLSGCSLFHIHKNNVAQGTIIAAEDVSRLHRGMSEAEVKSVLGTPLLVNVFTPDQVSYVYTFKPGYEKMQITQLTCYFKHGKLRDFVRG